MHARISKSVSLKPWLVFFTTAWIWLVNNDLALAATSSEDGVAPDITAPVIAPPATPPLSPIKIEPTNVPGFELSPASTGSPSTSINLASVTGKVTDLSGNRNLESARIVLSKVGEEHKRYQTESERDGGFSFNNVEPGDWTLTASAPDMLSYTVGVTLTAGETKPVKVALEELEPVDVLRVTGKRTLIHPERIGSETNIDHKTITQYRSGNSLRQLIESTPGVITDTYGNIIVRGEHNAINYDLDGVTLPEQAGVLQQGEFVSPRSLQSMRVDIGGYQAQDGGGPLGAVVHMQSLPITANRIFTVGQQIGGPMAGNVYYNASGALSESPDSKLFRWRYDSSGSFRGTSLGLAPPVKDFVHDNRADIDVLSKLEYHRDERNIFKLSVGINETFMQIPISQFSYNAGVREHQHDRNDFVILSYKHRFQRFFDEGNLHLINGFYYDGFTSRNAFDPAPVINGGQPLISLAPQARRFNYVFGAQGDINKTIKDHHLKAGYLSEVRPVRTDFNAIYYNNDPNNPNVTLGAVISPFTQTVNGPGFNNNLGRFKGFRFLQSAYLQDSWRPSKGFMKRLTLDAGVRFDLYHGVFGNTQRVLDTIKTIPDTPPFLTQPFGTQRVTNAQASGRYGAAFVLTPNTVLRGSFSNLFMPPPVDVFSTPPNLTDQVNGVFNGTVRAMQATRGELVDVSLERQIGPRFDTRTNLFYKKLHNYGDSGVIGNTPIYNRLTVDAQEAYGVETRVDLKRSRDGYGLNGFISNTFQIALLRGTKQTTGGIYDIQTTPIEDKYPDHDRRESVVVGLGYQGRRNWWVLGDYQFMSGLQDGRDPALVAPHPFRTPWLNIFGFSAGYKTPQKLKTKMAWLPSTFDARFENLFNNRLPTNLGSPFQGTRFLLPFRFLLGCSWQFGKQNEKLSTLPKTTATTAGPKPLVEPSSI